MKSDFVIADEHGRELFKEYAKNQSWFKLIKESKDEFSPWDISYWSGGTMVIGEIKVREGYNSKAFVDWDYEEKKHIKLVEILQKVKLKHPKKRIEIQYINIFNDEAIKIWTTTNIANEQQPMIEKRPATTYGKTVMVDKSNYKCHLGIEADRGTLRQFNYSENEYYKNNNEDYLPF